MINTIWGALLIFGILTAFGTGKISLISETICNSATKAFELAIGLAALLAFWSGIMKIAEASGITSGIARLFEPLLKRLFPTLKQQPKILGLISLTMAANLFGLGNVATPLGLQTMGELQKLNSHPERVSDEICTFLALVLGGISILPTTLLAIRGQAGSTNPGLILGPIFLVTIAGTLVALLINAIAIRVVIWRYRKD